MTEWGRGRDIARAKRDRSSVHFGNGQRAHSGLTLRLEILLPVSSRARKKRANAETNMACPYCTVPFAYVLYAGGDQRAGGLNERSSTSINDGYSKRWPAGQLTFFSNTTCAFRARAPKWPNFLFSVRVGRPTEEAPPHSRRGRRRMEDHANPCPGPTFERVSGHVFIRKRELLARRGTTPENN